MEMIREQVEILLAEINAINESTLATLERIEVGACE